MLGDKLGEGFHGRFEIDPNKCIGCGACVNVCSPGLINVIDLGERRIIGFALGRCSDTKCTKCGEVCPEKAITIKEEFQLPLKRREDLKIMVELPLVRCEHCGMFFTTQRIMDKLAVQLPREMELDPGVLDWLQRVCPKCRLLHESQKAACWSIICRQG